MASNARPIPRKNVAFRVYFPIFDETGALVSGAAGLDSEISKDGAPFADCTNEAIEIGVSGCYYLDCIAAEMNADAVCIIVKTTTVDAKTTPIILYPEELGDMRVTSTGSGAVEYTFNVIDSGALPLDGVCVWVTTDAAGTNKIASTYSNALGEATFYLDPGVYYAWQSLSNYTFVNPTSFTVV
jgi:hypothetical protein